MQIKNKINNKKIMIFGTRKKTYSILIFIYAKQL